MAEDSRYLCRSSSPRNEYRCWSWRCYQCVVWRAIATRECDHLLRTEQTEVSIDFHSWSWRVSCFGVCICDPLDFRYGTVFEATDETRKLAIKTEKYSKSMLHVEANVLKTATQQNCTKIVEFIEYVGFWMSGCKLVLLGIRQAALLLPGYATFRSGSGNTSKWPEGQMLHLADGNQSRNFNSKSYPRVAREMWIHLQGHQAGKFLDWKKQRTSYFLNWFRSSSQISRPRSCSVTY